MGLCRRYRRFCTLCWEICSSNLDVWVPMGSELASLFSVAVSHSVKGSRVSWNCCATTKIFSNCFCLPRTSQLVLLLDMIGFNYTVPAYAKICPLPMKKTNDILWAELENKNWFLFRAKTYCPSKFFFFFVLFNQNDNSLFLFDLPTMGMSYSKCSNRFAVNFTCSQLS